MPTMIHAGFYSAITHYLKGIEATGTDDPAAVREWMAANPINDFFAKDGTIREDGRMMHTMYLARVKAPDASESKWDVSEVLREIPAEDAFMPLDQSTCDLVSK